MPKAQGILAIKWMKAAAGVFAVFLGSSYAFAQPPGLAAKEDKPDITATINSLTPAEQDSLIHALCKLAVFSCVFDSHNQFVGTSVGANVQRRIDNEIWILNYDQNGFNRGVQFFYSDTACATTPYLDTGGYVATDGTTIVNVLPQRASFDGTNIWGSAAPGVFITVKSYRAPPMPCQTGFTVFGIVARPASIIDSTTFYPPFRVE